MAQYDVHRFGGGLVIDCQSDLLAMIATRFVIPLLPASQSMRIAARLNPTIAIEGAEYMLIAQAAASVRARDLGEVVTSLSDRALDVTGALDVLISGV